MEKPHSCPKCRSDLVQADAGLVNSIPYWYCRTCKEEVNNPENYCHEGEIPPVDIDLLEEFERLIDEANNGNVKGYTFVDPFTGAGYVDEEDEEDDPQNYSFD
jgi:hypothetical protein